jgi:serine/threonine-protein phosphatase PGAM5
MASSTSRLFSRSIPAVAGFVTSSSAWSSSSQCEAPKEEVEVEKEKKKEKSFGMISSATGDFHNLFPKRQLWQPKVEYPLWDVNWDDRKPASTGQDEEDRRRMRQLRKDGVTRHIILVRHGQYDETEKDDSKRILTELGRKQSELTGKRLRIMLDGINEEYGPCKIKVVRVSNITRAKETAALIAAELPGVEYADPDPNLNEGRPAHSLPCGKASERTIEKTDEQHARIEEAFRTYFHRADPPEEGEDEDSAEDKPKHEFEVIVCHANVIRYFLCRYVIVFETHPR